MPEPKHIDADGAIAKAICELKAAADFIADATDSYLGAQRMHQIADEAAEEGGLDITKNDHHKSGATQTK